MVVIVYGAPFSGTSKQAALLGQRYQLPVVSLVQLVQVSRQLGYCCSACMHCKKVAW
jgi:adenylate kinase family enzyme